MVSLEELQSGKALLKRRPIEPKADAESPSGANPSTSSLLLSGSSTRNKNEKTNIPLPTISLQTLASARVSLHKVSSARPANVRSYKPFATPDDNSEESLPAFSRRKEQFEKQAHQAKSSLATSAIVRVGEGSHAKDFTVDIKTLRSSPQFRDDLSNGLLELSLSNHCPKAFQLFLVFCESPKEPIEYQAGQYSGEPWITSSTAACLLSMDLRARRFEKYALSQFIQNCAIMAKAPWREIEDCVAPNHAIFRFSTHWVAWNTYLSNWWTHEYIGLIAVSIAEEVTSATLDPRIFDLEHWYQPCGNDINSLCEHNPIYRKQQQEKEAKRSRPTPSQWGAEEERQAQRNLRHWPST